ncbi:MAG TPA: Na(+)-translocating NADH-quinone reductase subunit A [Candidatus Prevotella avicola]|uniref:Na(+)-translocating NADH-quinone reductase subunit A n=1 Tax=Candidatus Prevotella avicola TaxID=2838738 RepID=A0A9D2FXI4_9BACT|nr:Na(+)-translocating NADH-quinone reductase subunit A [Candidatus Prevotella avicola]
MVQVVKLRKGLDIRLKGTAAKQKTQIPPAYEEVALMPQDFVGVTPKPVVREGDVVKAGDTLFVNKASQEVGFSSPVSGMVAAIVRGERRKVLRIVVKADKETQYTDYGQKDPAKLTGEEVKASLLQAGLFGYINQLPYAVSTTPATTPKAIFVSALRDMPLAADFEMELQGNEETFQAGLTALSKVAKTYLGIGARQTSLALTQAKDVEIYAFDGPCPAGNVGVQVNHIDPVNKGEVVWTVDPSAVIFFGRLFLTGKVDLRKVIAIAGSEMASPAYVETIVGAPLKDILRGQLDNRPHVRLINGNPLTGRKSSLDDYLGAHTSELTAIPEGDDVDEMLGWIMPRTRQFSTSRSYFSWLMGKKEYDLDARVKGGERHMIMSGEYDKVLPMDIYGEYLIKAIITGDIDKQEALGIYEVSPEDFALAEFVDSSKLELQKLVREGLDILRKENA